MNTNEIRKKFLDYFKSKAHTVVASDSLVPQNDPTLLFTGAGMNQFKDYFLGLKKDLKRAASSQKCLRTGDLEEVGRTPYHHSFFEMLGNFSFGDYFKREAIHWAWEFLTKELKISEKRLRISVHEKDEEAYNIWKNEIKIRPEWIYKMGDKSNFWPSNAPKDGPNGPCGPCSEIYFDQSPFDGEGGTIEDSRFAEIWNLVFTQYDRQDGGKLVPLAAKNIDTGMGLERLACVLQGQKTNYEIDIFQPINKRITDLLGISKKPENAYRIYSIADHVRAVIFSISDGVIPANEGRGYVIRKLIRRALWQAHQMIPGQTLEGPFLYKLVPVIKDVMKEAYPELKDSEASITLTLKGEEERFLETLETGLEILEGKLQSPEIHKTKTLPGQMVFELYDTYGFPDELTRSLAETKGLKIDQAGFDKLMQAQRERAKSASQINAGIFVTSDFEKEIASLPGTQFFGYDSLEGESTVLYQNIPDGKGTVVLKESPFYAESGGQVGDRGSLSNAQFEAKVVDTQKKDKVFLHFVEVKKGSLKAGDKVKAEVDRNWRERSMRNHTATHLLHAALRQLLGSQVRQLGSLVSPEKLRFDYSFSRALTEEEIKKIEDLVNSEILKNTQVTKEEKPIEQAKQEGAIAFFGEKYGDKVRVVSVPGFSKEFCGGTHCHQTGQIGSFVITSDGSIASGTRRIEALTGEGTVDYLRGLRSQISRLAQALKVPAKDMEMRIQKLMDAQKKGAAAPLEEIPDVPSLLEKAQSAGNLKFTAGRFKELHIDLLRRLSDQIRSKATKTVYFLGSENQDKILFLLGMSPDLSSSNLDMRDLGKKLAPVLKASAGGRKDLVQGGASNEGQLESSSIEIATLAVDYLKSH